MTRIDLQPVWEQIVDKGFFDYNTLSDNEKIWFNIEPITLNGLLDHYINYGADHNSDTISGLERLGFRNIANLMRKINSLFPNGKPSDDIDIRTDQMEDWDEKYEDLLDKIDDQFWEMNKELESKLESFIVDNFKFFYS